MAKEVSKFSLDFLSHSKRHNADQFNQLRSSGGFYENNLIFPTAIEKRDGGDRRGNASQSFPSKRVSRILQKGVRVLSF